MQYPAPAHELIERAFAQAKKAGKPEWWTMAIPVLKNRLLQITDQRFKESDYGASSFREFVQGQRDFLQIDASFLPGSVTLKSATDSAPVVSSTLDQRERIRPDLWKAILDYSSGNRYVWDSDSGQAVVVVGETQAPALPTLSAEGMKVWKAEFVASLPATSASQDRVLAWQGDNLPTTVLPSEARFGWNRYLKQKVLTTLAEWFQQQQIASPVLIAQPAPISDKPDETEQLRAFVIECVRKMSRAELEQVSIPSSVAFRAGSKH